MAEQVATVARESDVPAVQGEDVAYLFPGQGSQAVGMGRDLYEASPAARSVFDQFDRVMGRKLSNTMFDGPEAELVRTENAQPAIAAVSLALYAVLAESLGTAPTPAMVAGHSLGEYSALAVAGALSVPDVIRLVAARGRLMQEACQQAPGGMAALIGLDETVTEEICRQTGTYVSNINSGEQVIIAGDLGNLARAVELANARGARKAVQLAVGGAFHSGLMASAQAGLNELIEATEFRTPRVTVVSNCDAAPLKTAAEIKDELRRQLTSCVQWRRSITAMLNSGVRRFVEIGPGRVLTGLVKRIDSTAELLNVGTLAAARSFAA